MPDYLKSLVYILVISIPVFVLAKRIAVPFIPLAEFKLWRNCWFLATVALFFTSNFFIFALVMLPLCVFIHHRSASPLHLYIVLMFVAPCISVVTGIPGLFGKIVDLNPPRLLALFILLPVAVRLWREERNQKLTTADMLVGAFVLLISILAIRDPLATSIPRLIAGYILDIALPYFVFSRGVRTAHDVNSVLLAFAVATMPAAAIGAVEFLKSWRLYNPSVEGWGAFLTVPYLFRDGMLRAAVTAIEPIAYGFVCMTGAGCLLALRGNAVASTWRLCGLGVLIGGLLASISRGPWLGFAVCCMVMMLARPKTSIKLFCASIIPALALIFIFEHRLDRFINLLPFVGSADPGSETYRSELFRNALIVIERNPLFGSVTFLSEPEMLRMIQGQGIIDLVNSYLQVALEFGLAGLFLFTGYFAYVAVRLFVSYRTDETNTIAYSALLGILVGMLFTISTTSSVTFIPYLYWAFSGLCVAALRVGSPARASVRRPEPASGPSPGAFGTSPELRPRILGRHRT
ncbi:O-antigen ligase [Shinella sp. NM-101]|uniref:O-antigen ligase family protein n=1 Tax=Shinella sp. NM-101 TaxID=2744455 RepID=UPI001F1B2E2B|nr:O-antigen ligase family protein [Shinella sp. NM-101]